MMPRVPALTPLAHETTAGSGKPSAGAARSCGRDGTAAHLDTDLETVSPTGAASPTPGQPFSTCSPQLSTFKMVESGTRRLTPNEREIVARSIKAGRFRDFSEFQDFAVKQAVAGLLLDELRHTRDASGAKRLTRTEILREVKKVRHEVARKYGIA